MFISVKVAKHGGKLIKSIITVVNPYYFLMQAPFL